MSQAKFSQSVPCCSGEVLGCCMFATLLMAAISDFLAV